MTQTWINEAVQRTRQYHLWYVCTQGRRDRPSSLVSRMYFRLCYSNWLASFTCYIWTLSEPQNLDPLVIGILQTKKKAWREVRWKPLVKRISIPHPKLWSSGFCWVKRITQLIVRDKRTLLGLLNATVYEIYRLETFPKSSLLCRLALVLGWITIIYTMSPR